VLLLSAGNTNDITMAHALIEAAGPFRRLLADRGYDAGHLKKRLAERNAEAVIPTATSRKHPIPYDVVAYRQRNTVERLWARLKDYRRRHPLRQARDQLPLRRAHRRNHLLLGQMSPGPSADSLRARDTNLCRSRRGEVDDGLAVESRLAFVVRSV